MHSEARRFDRVREPDEFRELIGNTEFKNILLRKWHVSHDLVNNFGRVLTQLEDMQQRLVGQANGLPSG